MRKPKYCTGEQVIPLDHLRAIDDHDLKHLAEFWRGEVKALEAVGKPLKVDLELAQTKLARLNAEIIRRSNDV